MRELSVHAYLYRRDLGDPTAIDAARVLAVGIENPHLHELIDPGRAAAAGRPAGEGSLLATPAQMPPTVSRP